MRRFVAFALLLLVLPACGPGYHWDGERWVKNATPVPPPPYTVQFRPHTAARPRPTATLAKQFYAGDAKGIDSAAGQLVGYVLVVGKTEALEGAMATAAAEVAAGEGATHIMLTDERDTERTEVVRGASADTSCTRIYGNVFCSTSTTPEKQKTETTKRRLFAAFAVPVDAWGTLPKVLWPKPLPTADKADPVADGWK